MHLPSILTLILATATSHAHPGHSHEDELQARLEFLSEHANNIDHCAGMHDASGLRTRAIERRAGFASKLSRRIHGTYGAHNMKLADRCEARQVSPVTKSHKSDKVYTVNTDPKEIFAGRKSCVLTPQATEGPFCKPCALEFFNLLNSTDLTRHSDVTGEYIRSKLVDDQEGIPLHLDIQLVDVNTCQPMGNVFLELWSEFHSQSSLSSTANTALPQAQTPPASTAAQCRPSTDSTARPTHPT